MFDEQKKRIICETVNTCKETDCSKCGEYLGIESRDALSACKIWRKTDFPEVEITSLKTDQEKIPQRRYTPKIEQRFDIVQILENEVESLKNR
eukprot:UN32108